jgi:trehalose synthase-fused probable maltokinase
MASKPPPSDALAAWLPAQRWFGAKSRRIAAVAVEDSIALGAATLHVLRVTLDDGEVQRYAVPLADSAAAAGGEAIVDALDDPRVAHRLLALVRGEAGVRGLRGALTGRRTRALPGDVPAEAAVRKIGGEQSNTSLVIGDTLIAKVFRRLASGVNPELEITRFLTETVEFPHTAALAGWLEYAAAGEEPATLAVVQRLVGDGRDGWQWVLGALRDERRRGSTVPALRRLGEVTARLHLALAAPRAAGDGREPSAAALAPEPVTDGDIARWTAAIVSQIAAARAAAPAHAAGMPSVPVDQISGALASLRGRVKCRHHGDFHLGQTLYREATGAWTVIDFEGEPLRPLAERRQKHAPLRDVAGLLRSVAYAAETVRAGGAAGWIDAWERDARAAFLDGYLATAGRAAFLPEDEAAARRVVAAFEVEKAAYEVVYEANNRPDWIAIPLRGLVSAAAAVRPARAAGAA